MSSRARASRVREPCLKLGRVSQCWDRPRDTKIFGLTRDQQAQLPELPQLPQYCNPIDFTCQALSSPVKPCQATTFYQIDPNWKWNPVESRADTKHEAMSRIGLPWIHPFHHEGHEKYSCLSSQMFYPWHCTMDTIVAPSCWLKLAARLGNNDRTWSYVIVRDRTACRSSWESSGGPTSMYNDVYRINVINIM